jgi:hypothetical protein
LIIGTLLMVSIMVVAIIGGRSRNPVLYFRVNFLTNCAFIGLVAHTISPFFLAPTMIAIALNVYASQARVSRPALMLAGGFAALFVPLVLQLLDVVPRRFSLTDTAILFDPVGDHLNAFWVVVGLAIFNFAVVLSAVLLPRDQALDRDELFRKVQLHAWQLRQLVPQRETA